MAQSEEPVATQADDIQSLDFLCIFSPSTEPHAKRKASSWLGRCLNLVPITESSIKEYVTRLIEYKSDQKRLPQISPEKNWIKLLLVNSRF